MKTMTKMATAASLAMVLAIGSIAVAQQPQVDISKRRHPNLEAAQKLSLKAYDRLDAAQRANEFDMGGHAQHAKELLDQVNAEIKMAAEDANEKRR